MNLALKEIGRVIEDDMPKDFLRGVAKSLVPFLEASSEDEKVVGD